MNILEQEDLIKGMPDQGLQQEAQRPSGQVPQYLVISEIQRRTNMRKSFNADQQSAKAPTIKDQVVQEGITATQPQPPQGMPPQGMPPQGMAPQGAPQGPPQGMAQGGIVRMQGGGAAPMPWESTSNPKNYGTQEQILQAITSGQVSQQELMRYARGNPSMEQMILKTLADFGYEMPGQPVQNQVRQGMTAADMSATDFGGIPPVPSYSAPAPEPASPPVPQLQKVVAQGSRVEPSMPPQMKVTPPVEIPNTAFPPVSNAIAAAPQATEFGAYPPLPQAPAQAPPAPSYPNSHVANLGAALEGRDITGPASATTRRDITGPASVPPPGTGTSMDGFFPNVKSAALEQAEKIRQAGERGPAARSAAGIRSLGPLAWAGAKDAGNSVGSAIAGIANSPVVAGPAQFLDELVTGDSSDPLTMAQIFGGSEPELTEVVAQGQRVEPKTGIAGVLQEVAVEEAGAGPVTPAPESPEKMVVPSAGGAAIQGTGSSATQGIRDLVGQRPTTPDYTDLIEAEKQAGYSNALIQLGAGMASQRWGLGAGLSAAGKATQNSADNIRELNVLQRSGESKTESEGLQRDIYALAQAGQLEQSAAVYARELMKQGNLDKRQVYETATQMASLAMKDNMEMDPEKRKAMARQVFEQYVRMVSIGLGVDVNSLPDAGPDWGIVEPPR